MRGFKYLHTHKICFMGRKMQRKIIGKLPFALVRACCTYPLVLYGDLADTTQWHVSYEVGER
jgi:hypothetical protein